MVNKVLIDVAVNLPKQLEKDLQENERICTTCKGMGIVIRDNEYGLKNKEKPWLIDYPYKKQSLWPCPDCYNGVQRICKYCGQPGTRMYVNAESHCVCEEASAERSRIAAQKEQERWEKAEKITLEEAAKRFDILYIDGPDEYVGPADIEERLRELQEEDPDIPLPYVWGTTKTRLQFPSADDLISDACEELFEEAKYNIGNGEIKSLQEFLNNWEETVKEATTTYYPDYTVAVLINSAA